MFWPLQLRVAGIVLLGIACCWAQGPSGRPDPAKITQILAFPGSRD
jgi:hypothetical protein